MAEGPAHSLARLGNELAGQARQYARLMRLDKPVGIWLLLWPTLWGLWIAGEGRPDPVNFIVFVAGVILMRSAGCVINDYMAVGTTATAAYQLEAASTFDTPAHATREIDLTWVAEQPPEGPVLWEALHTLDDTFVVNQERAFQARNRDAREIELLVGVERAGSVLGEPLRPIPLPDCCRP